MNLQTLLEFTKIPYEHNGSEVRVERKLLEKNYTDTKDTKTRSYVVQLGSSTLILSKTNPCSDGEAQEIINQMNELEEQKKLYNQVFEKKDPLASSEVGILVRGGDLGKSGPGPRAKADARKSMNNRSPKGAKSKSGGSWFAEAWTPNHSNRLRPAAANRLAQQFQTDPVEGGNGLFGRFSPRPTPDPSNPGCASGPRSVTVLSSHNNSSSSKEQFIREITAHDGVKGRLTDKSTNHLTSKHAHSLGIDDPLPPNPNQNPTAYKQTRTRVNNENKEKFTDILEEILKDSNTEPFSDVSIRGIKSHGYYTEEYGESGFFVGIHKEGEFTGQIKKAQPISDKQLKTLQEENKID